LLLFRPHLEPHAAARFQAELRRLGGILGEARDWDVFRLETLVGADDGKPDADWKHLLQHAAEQAGTRAHAKVRDELAQPALTGLALALAAWSESDSFASGDAAMQGRLSDIAPALLDRVARKVDRRGRRIGRLSEAELHALRKALKKLRYSVDDFSGLYAAKPVKSYLKHCKRLQEQLGTINDAVVAAALADRLTQDGHIDLVPAASTLALWAEENRARALRRLPEAWDDFHAEARFWE
jgi:CHAD domain-containing protein